MKKQRNRFTAIILAFCLCVGLAACGGGSTASSAPASTQAAPAPSAADTAESEKAAGPEYVIRYAFTSPQDSQVGKIAEGFRDRVAEYSNGRIDVEFFPSAQLGDKLANMESLRAGELEMCDAAATDFSGYNDRWSVFALPYNFDNAREMLDVCRDEEVYTMLDTDATAAGFKLITFANFGARSVFNAKRPVQAPEDAKGIKIRVMQDPVLAKALDLMGFSAVSLGWSEVYTAMQQGTIDGCEQNEALCADNKLYEVAKYYSYTEHFFIPGIQYMSNKFFAALPSDLQDAVVRAGIDNEEYILEWFPAYNQNSIDIMKKNGVEFNTVDKAAFAEAVSPITDFYFNSAPETAKELHGKMMEVRNKLRG